MGINQVPIVEGYADINRRLAELQQQRQPRRFTLPSGIAIVASKFGAKEPNANMCFIVRGDTLMLLSSRTGDTLRSERGRDFINYLMQYCPALRFNETEIVLTKSDMEWLADSIGLTL